MSQLTIKEFADIIGLDKKKLEDKLRYQKSKKGLEFGEISEGVRYLSESDQKAICEALGIPFFGSQFGGSSVSSEDDNNLEAKLWKEKYELLQDQVSDLKTDKAELMKANSEMRILLQNSLKQNEQLQLELSEQTKSQEIQKFSPTDVVDVDDENLSVPTEPIQTEKSQPEFKTTPISLFREMKYAYRRYRRKKKQDRQI